MKILRSLSIWETFKVSCNDFLDICIAHSYPCKLDHILTLQHSLAHYERMLSQSHPTYLAQLRNMSEISKGSADQKLFYLTVITISCLCIQTLTGNQIHCPHKITSDETLSGLCSLNVHIPTNGHTPDHPYYVFGGVVSLAVIILVTFLSFVRYWWNNAKNLNRRSQIL